MALKVAFVYIINFIIFIVVGYCFYKDYQKQIDFFQQDIQKTFDTALRKDLKLRFRNSGMRFITSYEKNVAHPFANKGFELGSSKGTLIPYDNEIKKDFSSTGEDYILQYALIKKFPITFEGVDTMFCKELKVNTDAGKAYIHIYINGTDISPIKDKKPKAFYVSTELKCLDIKKIIRAQAFVEYKVENILRKMHKSFVIGSVTVLLLCGFSMILINRIRRQSLMPVLPLVKEGSVESPVVVEKVENVEKVEEKIYWEQLEEDTFKLGDIIFELSLSRVSNRATEQEIFLSPQVVQLLRMFLNAPDHYVRIEAIRKELWPDKVRDSGQTNRHITKLVSTLKSKLKEIVDIEFEKKGDIYFLRTAKKLYKIIEWREQGESIIGNYWFEPEQKYLRYHEYRLPLQSCHVLMLELFLKAPDHIVKKEEFTAIFRQSPEDDETELNELVDNKIRDLIKIFGRDPDLNIIKDSESSYKLIVNN